MKKHYLLAGALFCIPTFAQTPPPTELPKGGRVVSGEATIEQTDAKLNVNQSSDRAAIDWDSFDVGGNAQVEFLQPSNSSVTLNRVTGGSASQIFGRISANGQVFLSNPNGVYFSPTANVNVGGLIATTHTISLEDFMAGRAKFERNGATGSVINAGELQAALGGYIALLAPEVRNQGVILANLGTVALAAGEAFVLQFDGNNTLANLLVTPSTVRALVENRSVVLAPGGVIILSAQALDQMQGGVIHNTGALRATGLSQRNGRILLDASDHIELSGSIDANTTADSGGGQGGSITLLAKDITLTNTSLLSATGSSGGGSVLVGGGWQGGDGLPQATTVTMDSGARIDVSATENGDGGMAVLWSDVHNKDSLTTVSGTVLARGGAAGGNGGKVETSGHAVDSSGALIDAGADHGAGGLWLVDPSDSTITQSIANSYAATLSTGTSVINDVIGSITWDPGVSLAKTGNNTATLTMRSANNSSSLATIDMNGASISSTGGALNLVFWTRYGTAVNQGVVRFTNSNINTNGGHIWVGGSDNNGATVNWNGLTVGDGYALSETEDVSGIYISGSTFDTGAGSIQLNGRSAVTGANGGQYGHGIWVDTQSALTTTSGDLEIYGQLDGLYINGAGVYIGGFGSAAGNIALTSDSGSISITGMGTDATGSGTGWRHGLLLNSEQAGDQTVIKSTSGAITLIGRAEFGSAYLDNDSSGLQLQVGTTTGGIQVVSQTGDISLFGIQTQESATSRGQNAIRFNAEDATDSIRIGFDGTNAYSGNILIEGDSFWQRYSRSGAGAISVRTSGVTTFDSVGNSFTALGAGPGALEGSFTFDDDWNFGTATSQLIFGKPTNTFDLTLSNPISTAGSITIYGGNLTSNVALTSTLADAGILLKGTGKILVDGNLTTNGGDITLWSNSTGATNGGIEIMNGRTLSSSGGWITLGGSDGSIAGLPTTSTLGTALPTGYARNGTQYSGINLGTDIDVFGQNSNITINSAGGRIGFAGHSTQYSANGGNDYSFGILTHHGVNVNAGSGDIVAHGLADGNGGALAFNFGLGWSPFNSSGGSTTSTWTTQDGDIQLVGNASGNVQRNVGIAVDGTTLGTAVTFQNTGTNGGSVTLEGNASGGISSPFGLQLAQANLLSASGTIEARASAGSVFSPHASRTVTLGALAGSGVTSSAANIMLSADTLGAGAVTVNTSGALTVQPTGTSFSGALSWPNYTISGTLGGLTLGKNGNTADITIATAQSVAGAINIYGGNIAINAGLTATGSNTITLMGSGTVTDGASGFVSANALQLLGGNVTLDNASNNVGTLASSGVGGLTFVDSNTLTLGTVGSTNGVSASGVVDIGTLVGDLTLLQNVSTTNTSNTALTLNAGVNANAGTSTGGDLLVLNNSTVSVGAGGRGRLFSGGVANSSGLTNLIGSGSGRFRYNSDESTTNYTLALGTGLYAIYREQPTVTRIISNQSMVYGDTLPTWAFTVGSGVNGDTYTQAFATAPTVNVGGSQSTSNNYIVGNHALTGTGGSATSQLGYLVSGGITGGTLNVTPRALTVGYTGVNRVYDGTTNTTVTASDDRLTGDVLSIGWSSAAFNDPNAGIGKIITVTGANLTGADAGNYTLSPTGTGTADITPRTVTLSANRVYDGTTILGAGTVSIGNLVGSETLIYSGATINDGHVVTSGKYIIGMTLLDGANGGLAGNYQLPTLNAANAPVTITPRAIGGSAVIGGALSKVYDRTTTANGASISGSLTGAAAGDVLSLDFSGISLAYNSAYVANATNISASGIIGFSIDSSSNGGQISDYSFTAPVIANAAASITPRTLSVTYSGVSKLYDGNTNATFTTTDDRLAGDQLAINGSAAFSDANVGVGKTVTVTGVALSGADASNYSVASTGSTTANITGVGPVTPPTSPNNDVQTPSLPLPTQVQLLPLPSAVPTITHLDHPSVVVVLVREPTDATEGLVTATVPTELAYVGFSFKLPEALTRDLPPDTPIKVTRENGARLPVWLSFDGQQRRFLATPVSIKALPLRVAVTIGTQRVIVVISE